MDEKDHRNGVDRRTMKRRFRVALVTGMVHVGPSGDSRRAKRGLEKMEPWETGKLIGNRTLRKGYVEKNSGFDGLPGEAVHCNYEFVLQRATGWI